MRLFSNENIIERKGSFYIFVQILNSLFMEFSMRKIIIISTLLLITSNIFAQKADQMIGVTAGQLALGGSVVADPIDAPSMLYNPAAIGVLEINKIGFDVSLGFVNPPREIKSAIGTPLEKNTESNSNYYLGMGNGFAAKITDKIIVGVAAGGVSGMGVDFPSSTLVDNPTTPFPENVSVVSKKGLLKIVPTIAYKINNDLTIAASIQIAQQSLSLKTPAFILPQTENYGFGGSFGLIYKALPNLQLGLSYTSEINISEYEFNGTSLHPMAGGDGVYLFDMDSPQNVAFGIAFKPMSKLQVEADLKWYNFSSVLDKIDLTTPSGLVIPVNFGWEDQMVYSIGAKLNANECMTIMAGYSYGATPITDENVGNNLGSIAVVEHHISIGLKRAWNDNLSSTISFTHGLYNELESSVAPLNIAASQNIVFFQFGYRM